MEKSKSNASFPGILKRVLDVVFWLGIVWLALVALAFVVTMIDPGSKANVFETSTSYQLSDAGVENNLRVTSSDPRARVEMHLFGHVSMKTRNRWFLLPTLLGYLIWSGLYLVIIVELRRFFATLTSGNPFCRENARRITVIGGAIVGSFLLKTIAQLAAVLYMKQTISVNGRHMLPPAWMVWEVLRLDLLFIGLVVLAISGIFRLAAKLKEEQDLTI